MRIVKLSQEYEFNTPEEVQKFFEKELGRRSPQGRFLVTKGRIAKDGLKPGEPLVFTYQAKVVYTANAMSGLQPNHEKQDKKRYPSFFIIDLATLCKGDMKLGEVERLYNEENPKKVNLVRSQGWNRLLAPDRTNRIWRELRKGVEPWLAEEIADPAGFPEGAVRRVNVNAYERNPEARKGCIDIYGDSCVICGFNFGEKFGEVAEGYIHVHHLKPLHEMGCHYEVCPKKDLRPVCPNCHAVIHRRDEPYSIDEVKKFLKQNGAT